MPNRHLPPRSHLPLSLISLAVLALGQARAQTAPPKAEPTQRVEVVGMRAALESALKSKRDDNGIIDVIRAEDIAKFPDTNIAESLQRVPGVVVNRDAGEGRQITVRGLGADFTRIRINGMEAQATTGGTDSSGGNNRGRGFDFNVFASELFQQLTVRKTASADVDEGSLGATIDLSTAHPFDYNGFVSTAAAQARYNDLSGNTTPRAAFLISNTWEGKKFGALFSAAYSKRKLIEEGFSTVRWDNGASSGGWCAPQGQTANPSNSTATTCGPAAQNVPRVPGTADNVAAYNLSSDAANFHPRIPRYGRLTHDQDRFGATLSLQMRPQEATMATFDLLYSKLSATRAEDYLEALSFSRTAGQGGKPQTSVLNSVYAPNGALQYGVYNGVDIRAESRYDELSTEFTQPTLTVTHDLSPAVRLNGMLGQSNSKFRNPVQTTTTLDALNVNGYALDLRQDDRRPLITYPFDPAKSGGALAIVGVPQVTSGTQPATIANTTSSEIRIRPQGTNNRIDMLQLGATWDAVPDKVEVSGGLDRKNYYFNTFEYRRVNQNDTIFAPPAGATGLTRLLTDFGKGQGLPAGTVTSWVIPDLPAIAQAYDIYCNCIKSGPAGGPGDFTLSSITNNNARGNNRKANEKDSSLWLMADFRGDLAGVPLRGNAGARYVRTAQSSTGYQATASATEVTVDQSYNDFLPALNVAANLSRDLVLRLAAAKTMARPQLENLNPGGAISTTGNLTISTGNPLLKPFRATNFDEGLEWYFDKNALLGLGLFQKNISTYIQSLRTNVAYKDTGLPLSLLPANFTGDEVFQVTAPINTDGGRVSGVELNYQQPFTFLPGFARNFGVLASYTRVQSKIDYVVSPTSTATVTDDLINMSPKSWSLSLYYDDGRFSARMTANNRSTFLTRVPGQNNNDVEGKNGSTNIDASLSYKMTDKLEFTLEAVNLTNEPADLFISRARNSAVSYTVTGREYLAGLRLKF